MGSTVSLGFLLALLCLVAPQEEDSKALLVRKLAQEMATATLEGKFDELIDLTYPAFVESTGGREKAIAAVRQGMAQMQEAGFRMEEFKVGQPGPLHSTDLHQFIVLPTETLIAGPQGKIKAKSYLLGISADAGKTWKFVDGAGLQRKANRDRLPKLPEGFELPPFSQPELLPDK